jgi:glycosyltransferase involved in cell wall biosynthesis
MRIDVFVDFTRAGPEFDVPAAIVRLQRPELLGAIVRRATCAVAADQLGGHVGPSESWTIRVGRPVHACRDAMAGAADAACPLMILLGDVQPGCEAAGLLGELIESDPMIGCAFPRLTGTTDSSLARLDSAGDRAIDEIPRRLIAEMPDTYIVADVPGRCLLVKPAVMSEFGELDVRFRTLAGALWHHMTRARRCGFRTLVCNRAVVRAPCTVRPCLPSAVTLRSLPDADRALLRELSPDIERTRGEFGTATAAATETRLARALPAAYGIRPSLLLDARNIVAGMNGTTVAALGISAGLHALRHDWDVTLLAPREASAYHGLAQSFSGWEVTARIPDRQFTAALRLSQPWHIQEMIDLHAAAAYNAYLFLDTISWDIGYAAPRHLDGTWAFMADHADALLFISEYTRARFRRRFAAAAGIPDLVSYLSFDPADYIHPDVRPAMDQDRFIFIVGNEYDHKDVEPTMQLLAAAFPYESIVALGPQKAATPRVKVLQSGTMSDIDMHRLYAGARVVVFPSFYEGFGLPILTTLAYGGTVVARQSALLDEIAARSMPGGRLVPFSRRDDLVDVIGRILHGEEVDSFPLGTALEHGRPMSWQDVAEQILAFLIDLTGDLSRSGWRSRERSIGQLLAAPASLVEKGLQRPALHAEASSAV